MKYIIIFKFVFFTSFASCFSGNIHDFVKNNDILSLKKLVSGNKSLVNEKDDFSRTPLHFAAFNEKVGIEIISFLLENGACIDDCDIMKQTPFYWVCVLGDPKKIDLLLKYGADPNKANSENETPFYRICCGYKNNIVKKLMENGAHVDQKCINSVKDSFIKKYLFVVLKYNSLKNKREKIDFILEYKNKILENSDEQDIFNFLIRFSCVKAIQKIKKNLEFIELDPFFQLYNMKKINMKESLKVSREDNYIQYLKNIIEVNDFYFAKNITFAANKKVCEYLFKTNLKSHIKDNIAKDKKIEHDLLIFCDKS